MKRAAVILLSLFFVYGGVARALATCLRHHEHPDHSSDVHHSHSHGSSSSNDSADSAGSVIHCPLPEHQIGPAASSGLTTLRRMHEFMSVHAPFFYIAGSATPKDSRWLEAVFRPVLTSFYPDNLGRHLFLSVLRI
jgi:hypothetical protein